MTKKTARIKVVADGKAQYVDVDVTVDDPPAKSTPSTPTGTTSATPTPARKSPLGCLTIPIFLVGVVGVLFVCYLLNSVDANMKQNSVRGTQEALASSLESSVFLTKVQRVDDGLEFYVTNNWSGLISTGGVALYDDQGKDVTNQTKCGPKDGWTVYRGDKKVTCHTSYGTDEITATKACIVDIGDYGDYGKYGSQEYGDPVKIGPICVDITN